MKKRNLGNRKGQRIRQAVGTSMLSVSIVLTSGVTVLAEEAVMDSENVVTEAVVEDAEKAAALDAEVALAEDYTGWDTLKVFETTDVHGYITDVSTYKDETFQYRLAYIANVVNQVANAGRTALVVTHDPEFILRCCNYVLHLENGQILESYSIENGDGRNRLLKFFLNDMEKEVSTE